MTTRYTNHEWATFIAEVDKEVVVSKEPYPCPEIGSPAFAKTIDHTLLKLDSRAVQFDALCAEARVNGFAVRGRKSRMLESKAHYGVVERMRPSTRRLEMRFGPQGHQHQGRERNRLPRGDVRPLPQDAVRSEWSIGLVDLGC